jgi:hypothetical protein
MGGAGPNSAGALSTTTPPTIGQPSLWSIDFIGTGGGGNANFNGINGGGQGNNNGVGSLPGGGAGLAGTTGTNGGLGLVIVEW